MLVSGEPRHANSARHPIRRDLHQRTIFVFVCDPGRDGPRLRRVTRRKRTASVEELTALTTVQRTPTSRNSFQGAFHDKAVDHRLCTQQSCLARSIVILRTTNEIESPGGRRQTVDRSSLADSLTGSDRSEEHTSELQSR